MADLAKSIRSKTDMINFFRERSNYKFKQFNILILYIDKYFPGKPGFDFKFFIQCLKGEKDVK